MARYVLAFLFFFYAVTTVSARTGIPDADTSIPGKGYLFVINGKIAGRIEQKDLIQLDSLREFVHIRAMNVLKDTAAIAKYGDAGSQGVIELVIDGDLKIKSLEVQQAAGVDTSMVIENPEIQAAFPGGDAKWRYYLERNLDASIPVKMKAPDGTYTVFVKFIVDTKGNISNIKSLTNHGYGMESEVIRLIKKSPKWAPAVHNGKIVSSWRKQPVTFTLSRSESP